MAGETLNVTNIHNNGKPETIIGIRDSQLRIAFDASTNKVSFYNVITGEKVQVDPECISVDSDESEDN